MTWREYRLREKDCDVTGVSVTCSCQRVFSGEKMESHLASDKHSEQLARCRGLARKRAAAHYERVKTDRVVCECGAVCLRRGLWEHKKTAKHCNAICS